MAETVTIGKIRARADSEQEPRALRLRLSHLMTTAEFTPLGLPPQAILLIRRMAIASPLPTRRLRVSRAWQSELQDAMTHCLRVAVRPQRGRIPADANAVLFADLSELIAALSLPNFQANAEVHWVWQSATKSAAVPEIPAVQKLWQENARLVPGILAYLADWQQATGVLAAFSEAAQVQICRNVLAAFGISVSSADLQILAAGVAQTRAMGGETLLPFAAVPPLFSRSGAFQETSVSSIRLREWLPREFQRTLAHNAPAAQILQIVAFLIRHSGSQSVVQDRLDSLVAAAQAFMQQQTAHQITPHSEQNKTGARQERTKNEAALPDALPAATAPRTESASAPTAPQAAASPSVPFQGDAPTLRQEPARTETLLPDETRLSTEAELPAWADALGVGTQFGGIFYLLNVILRSEFWSKSEDNEAEPPAVGLSLWFALERFGRMLLDEVGGNDPEDAIWEVLAQLDNRAPEASDSAEERQNVAAMCAGLRQDLAARMRWDETNFQEKFVSLLCVPAVIYVSAVHLDMVFGLESINLAVRLAGLDASPGWLPEVLRVVLFHFE